MNPTFVSICSLFWLPVSREKIFWSFFLTTVFLDFTAQVYRNTNKRLRGLFTTFPSRSGDSSREYGTSIKFLRTCVLRTGRKTWDFLTVVPVKALCCPFNKRFSEYQSDTLFFLCFVQFLLESNIMTLNCTLFSDLCQCHTLKYAIVHKVKTCLKDYKFRHRFLRVHLYSNWQLILFLLITTRNECFKSV